MNTGGHIKLSTLQNHINAELILKRTPQLTCEKI